MSEQNGSEQKKQGGMKKGTKQERRLSNVNFFRLCEEMRNRREVLTTERPTLVEAAKQMSERLGFLVAETTFRQAQEATGITWTPKVGPKSGATKTPGANGNRIVMRELLRLIDHVNGLCGSLNYPLHEMSPITQRLQSYYEECRKGGSGVSIVEIAAALDTTQMLTQAAVQVSEAEKVAKDTRVPEVQAPAGQNVFKVGDCVMVDGSPFKKFKIMALRDAGRLAMLDDNREIKVARLALSKK